MTALGSRCVRSGTALWKMPAAAAPKRARDQWAWIVFACAIGPCLIVSEAGEGGAMPLTSIAGRKIGADCCHRGRECICARYSCARPSDNPKKTDPPYSSRYRSSSSSLNATNSRARRVGGAIVPRRDNREGEGEGEGEWLFARVGFLLHLLDSRLPYSAALFPGTQGWAGKPGSLVLALSMCETWPWVGPVFWPRQTVY